MVRSFVTIEMDGKPFRIRKYEIGQEDDGKPTLVWVHGFAFSSALYAEKWKELSERYRLIYFDCFGFGQNTRLQECSGLASPEAAE